MQDRLWQALVLTLTDPRQAARIVTGWRLGWGEAALVLATGIALSMLIGSVAGLFIDAPAPDPGVDQAMVRSLATITLVALILSPVLVLGIGRMFGGTGTLLTVFAALAWVWLAGSLLDLTFLVALLLPGVFASVLFWVANLWSFWIFACFVAAAHDFQSPWRVLLVSAAVSFGLIVVVAVLMIMAGIEPPRAI